MSSATTVAGFLFAHRRLRGAAGNGEHGAGRRGPDRPGRGGYPRRDVDPASRRDADVHPRHAAERAFERRGASGFDRDATAAAAEPAPRAPKIYRDRLQYNRESRARILPRRDDAKE